MPGNLRDKPGRHGAIGAKLPPVFRDRDELAAGSNLGQAVKDALAESDSLIVICSPSSVQSRWVNEEIREFRRLGRADRTFCLVVDGEPNPSAEDNCLPPALFEDGGHEPLAADVRREQDGKRAALLKLVAPMLGVSYDDLRQREHVRRIRRLTFVATSATIAFVITAALAVTAYLARTEALRQRDIARDRTLTAERTVAFVTGMFRVADPSENRGETITAREILDRAMEDYRDSLTDEPDVKAEIGLTLSEVYGALGLFRQSDRIARSTLEIPTTSVATRARREMILAESQFRLGDYAAALRRFERSSTLAGEDSLASETLLARILVGMGEAYSAIDAFDRAETILKRALAIELDENFAGERNLPRLYEALGLNDFYAGDFDAARRYILHANRLRLEEEGPNSPSVSDNYNTLASIAYLEGEDRLAERLFRSRLAIDERVLGPEHPDVAITLNNIGRVMIERRAFAGAEPLLARAVAISRRERGATHDDMAFMLANLALARQGLGRWDDAEALFRESITAARAHGHRNLAPAMTDLAGLLCRRGDTRAGLAMLDRAAPIMRADYEDEAWRTAWLRNVRAECRWLQGDRQAARQLFQSSRAAILERWDAAQYYGAEVGRRARFLS